MNKNAIYCGYTSISIFLTTFLAFQVYAIPTLCQHKTEISKLYKNLKFRSIGPEQLHKLRDTLKNEREVPTDLQVPVDSVDSLPKWFGTKSPNNGLRDDIYDFAAEFIHSGVGQRSLFPPTKTHHARKRRLSAKLEKEWQAFQKEILITEKIIEKYFGE